MNLSKEEGLTKGPMPVEMVFAGLIGCTHVISNKLAKANDVEITDMDIDVPYHYGQSRNSAH